MKTILVPVESHDRTEAILSTALAYAKNFASAITGFALAPATTPFLAADVIGASVIYEPLAEYSEESVHRARAAFERFMTERSVKRGTAGEGPGWTWRSDVPPGDHMVGHLGRIFDITVVGRPEARVSGPRAATLDAALFDSGRPILIAPPTAPTHLGENIVVAWNRSTETARCVAVAMPLLHAAKKVTVLTVTGSMVPGPDGDAMALCLQRNGIAADSVTVDPGSKNHGEVFLDKAAEIGCDLLIKGAYTQSRLRQMIFGGATSHILAKTTIPVFMAH